MSDAPKGFGMIPKADFLGRLFAPKSDAVQKDNRSWNQSSDNLGTPDLIIYLSKFFKIFSKNDKLKFFSSDKNKWLIFILDSIVYVILVFIIGIIGANLSLLSELSPKDLKNTFHRSFEHSVYASEAINIDHSVNPDETTPSLIEWCAFCDLGVQIRLLLKEWPLKIKDASNKFLSGITYSLFNSFSNSSDIFRVYLLPIILVGIIYFQIPMFIGFIAALYTSLTLHPHGFIYWLSFPVVWPNIRKTVFAFINLMFGNLIDDESRANYLKIKIPKKKRGKNLRKAFEYYISHLENLEQEGMNLNVVQELKKSIEESLRELNLDDPKTIDNYEKDYSNRKDDKGRVQDGRRSEIGGIIGGVQTGLIDEISASDALPSTFFKDMVVEQMGGNLEDNETNTSYAKWIIYIKNKHRKSFYENVKLDMKNLYETPNTPFQKEDYESITKLLDTMFEIEKFIRNSNQSDWDNAEAIKLKEKIKRLEKQKRDDNNSMYIWKVFVSLLAFIFLGNYILQNGTFKHELKMAEKLDPKQDGGVKAREIAEKQIQRAKSSKDYLDKKASKAKEARATRATRAARGPVASWKDFFLQITPGYDNVAWFVNWIIKEVHGLVSYFGAERPANILRYAFDTLKTALLWLYVGIWFAPTWGFGICVAYSIFVQIKYISLTLFGSSSNKNKGKILTHLTDNKFGLSVMSTIMIAYAAMSSLKKRTAIGIIISLVISIILLYFCQ